MGDDFEHSVFKNDPLKFESYVDNYVDISLTNDTNLYGYIHAIDPVSESVILLTCGEEPSKVIFIMGNSIKNIELLKQSKPKPNFNFETKKFKQEIKSEELEKRKKNIIHWLSQNLLTVQDMGTSLVVHNGNLQILAPFTHEDCISDSTLILGRIQHLLLNMPTIT